MTSAALIRSGLLEPALDIVAINRSHMRALVGLAAHGTPGQRAQIRAMVADLNAAHQHARQIAGLADDLATAVGRAQHQAQPPAAWGAKRLARELRPHLANLTNPIITGPARNESLAAVRRIIDDAPRTVLLSSTLTHELGARKTAALRALCGELEAAA